jgi:membrane protein
MKNTQAIDLIKSSQGRRLIRLFVAAVCFITLTWLAFNTSFQSHQLLHKQADLGARSLVAQLALNAIKPIQNEDMARLKELCDHLERDEHMLSVAIYNQAGHLLTAGDNFVESPSVYGLPDDVPGVSQLKNAIVMPIIDNDEPLGFVSTVYLTQSAMSQSHYHFHELGRMVLLMLLITCAFTWQIGRALKSWEVKRQIRKSTREEE